MSTPAMPKKFALLGNVSVGKTCLFDRLCGNSYHSINIPGSTQHVNRGLLSVGAGAAARPVRSKCAACHSPMVGVRGPGDAPCWGGSAREAPQCPALQDQGGWPWRRKRSKAGGGIDFFGMTHLFDTPGAATLAANDEDEMVSRDLLLSGGMDGAVVVADAKNLRRGLAFFLELVELGLPLVLDLNMDDEAENMGITIDQEELGRILGVPVCRTVAIENRGVRQLAETILEPRVADHKTPFAAPIESALAELEQILVNPKVSPRTLGLLLLCEDQAAERWLSTHLGEGARKMAEEVIQRAQAAYGTPLKGVITDAFFAEAERISTRVVTVTSRSPDLLVRFGHLAQMPISGTLIGVGVLVLAYYWIGAFGATFVVDTLSTAVFQGFLIPASDKLVQLIPSAFVRAAIMDPDFGLLPSGLFLALGIVLPVLFCFYLFQALLEDSGYLPRLAVLFDRLFRRIGLTGQGLIPLVLGFSCIAMAVITARMLPTRKERNILTLLVVGVPCAPLLAVMFVILGKMPWTAGALIFGLIGLRIVIAGYISSKLMAGGLSDLILEIPKMRIPRPGLLLVKTWRRTWEFMREAVPIFMIASFAVFLFNYFGGLKIFEELARPLVHGLLGLPDQAVQVFIKTAIRRENGAAELDHARAHFDNLQMVVTLVVMTFVMPCINTTIVIIKERGLRVCLSILVTVVVTALMTGALINVICRGLGITFS